MVSFDLPFLMDESLLSIWSSVCDLLVKKLITLEPHGLSRSSFYTYAFYHCPATSMQNGDEALLSIRPAGHGQLVKIAHLFNRVV